MDSLLTTSDRTPYAATNSSRLLAVARPRLTTPKDSAAACAVAFGLASAGATAVPAAKPPDADATPQARSASPGFCVLSPFPIQPFSPRVSTSSFRTKPTQSYFHW